MLRRTPACRETVGCRGDVATSRNLIDRIAIDTVKFLCYCLVQRVSVAKLGLYQSLLRSIIHKPDVVCGVDKASPANGPQSSEAGLYF